MRFAAIADDYTGGSDLAGMLWSAGLPTAQYFGIPGTDAPDAGEAQAVVVALKSRSVEPERAVEMSLQALDAVQRYRPRQIQFKYCSTFDSTERGNIGPVADALMSAMGVRFTVAVPSLPVNGRTQYMGHLFVNGELLSKSAMRHHPLNPMTDSNLVRWLGKQSRNEISLVDLVTVRHGAEAIRRACDGRSGIALVDCTTDDDLREIVRGCADLPFVTGGSGLGMYVDGSAFRDLSARPLPARTRPRKTLVLAGSCSAATLQQLRNYPVPIARLGPNSFDDVARGTMAVASSAAPGERDPEPAAAGRIERAFGELARRAVEELGVTDIIVAGGETSGAVVEALGVQAVQIAGIVAQGVPSLCALGPDPLRLVLKSGNFGQPDFFQRADAHLEGL